MGNRARSQLMVNLFPVVLGLVLLIVGITQDSRRNVFIGSALAATGVVGFIALRVLPPAPQLSPDIRRARRTTAVILPNGIIYLILAILLRTALPASQRGGTTFLITLFAFVMGLLSVLSGLGAIFAVRRLDAAPSPAPVIRPTEDDEKRADS